MYADFGPGHVAELDPPSSDGLDLLYSDEYVADRMRQRNLYAYVTNNPVNMTDPSGLIPATTPGKCNAPPLMMPQMTESAVGRTAWFCCMNNILPRRSKFEFMDRYGKVVPSKIPKSTPNANIDGASNPELEVCGRPGPKQYFGVSGLGPSVGFVIQCEKNGVLTTVIKGHASGSASPFKYLQRWNLSGCHGIICGGDNTPESNCLMAEIIGSLNLSGVKIDGLVDWTGCFVDRSGNPYRKSGDKGSNNR